MAAPSDDEKVLSEAVKICSKLISSADAGMREAVAELARRVWLALADLKDLGVKIVTKVEGEIKGIVAKEDLHKHIDKLRLDIKPQGDERKIKVIEELCNGSYKLEKDQIEPAMELVKNGLADLYITPPMPIDIHRSDSKNASGSVDVTQLRERVSNLKEILKKLSNGGVRSWVMEAVETVERLLPERCPQCGDGLLKTIDLGITTFKGEIGSILRCSKCGYTKRL